jgi:hypothetical protein
MEFFTYCCTIFVPRHCLPSYACSSQTPLLSTVHIVKCYPEMVRISSHIWRISVAAEYQLKKTACAAISQELVKEYDKVNRKRSRFASAQRHTLPANKYRYRPCKAQPASTQRSGTKIGPRPAPSRTHRVTTLILSNRRIHRPCDAMQNATRNMLYYQLLYTLIGSRCIGKISGFLQCCKRV